MTFKKFKSLVFLGRHIVQHFVRVALRRRAPGLQSFLDNYRADKIVSVDALTRRDMPLFSRCHVCRLCDTVCPAIARDPGQLSPSYLVSAFSRSLPDYAYYQASRFDCGSCRQCEDICPQGVPIRRIADFMREQSESFQRLALKNGMPT